VKFWRDPVTGWHLSIADDGAGFTPESVPSAPEQHYGLTMMRERATSAGGRLELRATAGSGTTVEIILPVAAQPRDQNIQRTDRTDNAETHRFADGVPEGGRVAGLAR
jgi:signal transduction histidine kinase